MASTQLSARDSRLDPDLYGFRKLDLHWQSRRCLMRLCSKGPGGATNRPCRPLGMIVIYIYIYIHTYIHICILNVTYTINHVIYIYIEYNIYYKACNIYMCVYIYIYIYIHTCEITPLVPSNMNPGQDAASSGASSRGPQLPIR